MQVIVTCIFVAVVTSDKGKVHFSHFLVAASVSGLLESFRIQIGKFSFFGWAIREKFRRRNVASVSDDTIRLQDVRQAKLFSLLGDHFLKHN